MSKFYSEVQNEVSKNAEYHTLALDDAARKYKKGFVCVLDNSIAVSLEGWNSSEEFENMLGVEPGTFSKLDMLEIGESVYIGSFGTYTRIW